MNIVVCLKPVPDASIISLNTYTGHIDNGDLVYKLNPCDMVAVEEAVRIKEKDGVSRVILVSVCPPSTKGLLRRCLAMGVDESTLLWDSSFDISDSYAVAVILAKAISSLQYDLVLCGEEAVDNGAGQVGNVIATMLDIPVVSSVVKVEVSPSSREVIVESKLGRGNRARVEVILPALLMVEVDLNEPRYASLPSLMASLRKDIKEHNLRELGLSYDEVGYTGSKTKVIALSVPKPRPKNIFTPDSNLSAAERLLLIRAGGIAEKEGQLLEGNPKEIALTMVQFLREKNLMPSHHRV